MCDASSFDTYSVKRVAVTWNLVALHILEKNVFPECWPDSLDVS